MENENTKTWTAEIWEESLPIYESILEQPFIRELADGSLSQERFSRYIAQDEIYLGNYGKQMEAFAELLDDADEKAMFKAFAEAGMESEKAMHQLLIERCGIDCDVQPSPVTLAYGEHSRKAIESGVKEIALAALLPCMWIYNRVGLGAKTFASTAIRTKNGYSNTATKNSAPASAACLKWPTDGPHAQTPTRERR